MRTVAIGVAGGVVLGIAARAWMRLIADDPEFTWSGTMGIIVGFAIFGFTQSVGRLTRPARRRWVPTFGRALGIVGLLPLFVGAGGIMAPTVIAGGLWTARSDQPRSVRLLCAAIATAPVVAVGMLIVSDFGWSLHGLAGLLGAVVVYGVIVRVAFPTFAPRLDGRRWHSAITVMGLAVLGLLSAVASVGIES